ncbi:hypothetical protein FQA39_LY02824 [Lamprigera yunnana]|nr:hypothetical protein FQA39_LY02824 [Lamprigera yunnana]
MMHVHAFIALVVEDENINVQIINNIALALAEPLNIIGNEIRERIAVPRNLNYYEETIPQYLGICSLSTLGCHENVLKN